jgi:hypothetical protein
LTKLDRHERVETKADKAPVGIDVRWAGMAEDGGRLTADEIQQDAVTVGLGEGEKALLQR